MKVVCWPTWITVLCCLFFERLVLAVCGLPVSNQLGPRPIRACGGGGSGWGSHFKDCEISKSAQVYQWISVSESVEFSSVHFAMWQSQGPKVKQKKFSFQFIYYLTKHIYIKLMWHERYPKDTQIQTHMRASWNFISIWKKFDFIYLSQHHQKTSWISAFLLEFLYFFFRVGRAFMRYISIFRFQSTCSIFSFGQQITMPSKSEGKKITIKMKMAGKCIQLKGKDTQPWIMIWIWNYATSHIFICWWNSPWIHKNSSSK